MSELFSQRNLLLNSQNKCDLDQLFKAKMKLINEPNLAPLSHLNSSSSSSLTKNVIYLFALPFFVLTVTFILLGFKNCTNFFFLKYAHITEF